MKIFRCLMVWALVLLCLTSAALADMQLFTYAPLSWDQSAAPYPAIQSAFLPDQAGYHDNTLDIRVERRFEQGCKIVLVYVTISDVTQLRTGMAPNNPFSQETAEVPTLAQRNNAVLAINGDFFNYHNDGIVYRNTKQWRFRPEEVRDTLIIDENGDFTILQPTSRQAFDAFQAQHQVIHAFCFGPGLVVNGEKLTSLDHISGLDIMPKKQDQRMAIGQLGPKQYLIVAVDGPAYAESAGMTILELATYCKDLGCVNAYNLDGGNSAYVLLGKDKLNALDFGKSRTVCDIIYFATMEPNK